MDKHIELIIKVQYLIVILQVVAVQWVAGVHSF